MLSASNFQTLTQAPGQVLIFLGAANNPFSQVVSLTTDIDPSAVVVAHLDDDNLDGELNDLDFPDLAVANFGNPPSSPRNFAPHLGSVGVFRNNRDATFGTFESVGGAASYGTAEGTYSLVAADLDDDDDYDLAVVNGISDSLSLLINDGRGAFDAQPALPLGTKATSVTAEDLDDDNDLDLAISNGASDGVVILRNDGLANFTSAGVLGVGDFPKSFSFSVTSGDVDGDGTLDLAVARGLASEVTVLKNSVVTTIHEVRLTVNEELDDQDFGLQFNNRAPTEINLTSSSLREDADTSQALPVGTLSVVDLDFEDTHVLELAPDTSSIANELFEIVGNQLLLKSGVELDHETQDPLSVRVQATDSGQLVKIETLLVRVTDVNEAPSAIALVPDDIDENTSTANDVQIGLLSASDPDDGDSHEFSLFDPAGDTDNSSFVITDNRLFVKAGVDLDHEATDSYSIRVRATDSGPLHFDAVFTIHVNDRNEVPTDINLTVDAIDENTDTTNNVQIGLLSASDPDDGDSHEFSLFDPAGDTGQQQLCDHRQPVVREGRRRPRPRSKRQLLDSCAGDRFGTVDV